MVKRFINADSSDLITANPYGLTNKNLFAYCDNDPVQQKDSSGDISVIAAAAIAGGIAGAYWGGISAGATGGNALDVLKGTSVGMVAGALSGAVCVTSAVSVGLKMATGATIGGVSYALPTPKEDATVAGLSGAMALSAGTMGIGAQLPAEASISMALAGTYLLTGVSSFGTAIIQTAAKV